MDRRTKNLFAVGLFAGCVVTTIVVNTNRITSQQQLNQRSIEDRKGIHDELNALAARVKTLEGK